MPYEYLSPPHCLLLLSIHTGMIIGFRFLPLSLHSRVVLSSRYSLFVDMPHLWALDGPRPSFCVRISASSSPLGPGRPSWSFLFFSYFTIATVSHSQGHWHASGGAAASISPLFYSAPHQLLPTLPFSLAPFSAAASQICTVNHFPSIVRAVEAMTISIVTSVVAARDITPQKGDRAEN